MNVEIVDAPELRTAGVRHVGPYNLIGNAYQKLGAIAGPAGLFGPDSLMIGLYHDDPRTTPESELRSDAAVTIAQSAAVPDGLTETIVPAGKHLRLTHVGPYEGLPGAWDWLMSEGIPSSGRRPRYGVSYEVYRNNPETTPPEKLITEIYFPVE